MRPLLADLVGWLTANAAAARTALGLMLPALPFGGTGTCPTATDWTAYGSATIYQANTRGIVMLGGATASSGGYRAATLSSSEALLCVNHNGAAFTTGRCMVGSENAAGDKAFLLQLSGGGVQVYSDVAAHGTFLAQGSSFGLSGAAWGRVSIGADLGGGSGTHTYAVSCDGINYQTVYSVSGVPAKFLIGQIVASLNVAYALEIRT